MTNFARHVDLTLTEKLQWRPAREGEPTYDYLLQKSPSGQARCRRCSQNIGKGELRCGLPIKHQMGEYGWISAWQHLGCTRVAERPEGWEAAVYGLSALAPEARAEVLATLTSEEVPEHMKPLDPDDLVRRGRLPEEDPPRELLRPLLPYQREGFAWMARQERETPFKGGILADEMGMGKTIQTIAMLLRNRVAGPTLVVCPVSSMLQWESEISEHVMPGTLSVLVVYKTTKVTREAMEAADVVLTTYPMIEHAWRALVNEIKVPCPYCQQLFIPRQLVVHNKYFCGPRAKKTMKQLKREKAKAPRNNKVQSKTTIRKGLKTLRVDIEEDDVGDEEDGENTVGKSGGGGGKAPARKAPKREEAEAVKREGAVKKEEAAAEDENEDEKKATPRGVVGPIGMYQELMREAGRTVRSRWDPARRHPSGSSSSAASDSSASSPASSEDDSGSDSSDSDDGEEGEEGEEEEDANNEMLAAVAEERRKTFCCDQCGFQRLRFPFCPKTGQHHVLSPEMLAVIENDTGGDDVDLSQSLFHSVRWARVVLDEAHRIKGRTTSTARSAFALSAEYRWCLTGTPLQNRVGDVYSLLRFLRVSPFSRYYCGTEGCSCSSLSHPFSASDLHQCVFCGHGPVQHYAYFNKHVLNPITRYGYVGDGRKGMMMLTNEVFSKCMLRRTKAERAADLRLPPLSIEVRHVQLTPEERNFYESLYKKSTADFDTFVKKGTVLHNYAHIFQLLSRLRQALDHPLLVVNNMHVGEVLHAKGVCGICGEGVAGESVIRTSPCKHVFHRLCLGQFLESAPDAEYHCPLCFVKINVDLRQLRGGTDEDGDETAALAAMPPELEEEGEAEAEAEAVAAQPESAGEEGDSPKTPGRGRGGRRAAADGGRKMERGILARLDTSKPLHGTKLDAVADYVQSVPEGEKVILFSQFGDALDLMQFWLQKRLVKSVKLTGSLTLTQRQSVLQAFLHDASVRAILISLKAGGEGLNLQVANHVVLLDPWWNPAVEMQAVQRAHRIGQTRPVHAVRFVTAGSVEERMVELQDKKMLVFEGTVDGEIASLNKLSGEDLQFLFTR